MISLNKRIFAAVFLALWVPAAAPAQETPAQPAGLQDCYQAAVKQSETIKIAYMRILQADQESRRALSTLYPRLALNASEFIQDNSASDGGGSVGGTLTRNERPEAKLSLKQPLFSGFKEFASVRGAKALKLRQALLMKESRQDLYLDVAGFFYDVLRMETEIKDLDTILQLTRERLKELENRVELGKSRESEVLTTESQLATLQSQRERETGSLLQARESLATLTGLPADTPLTDPPDSEQAPAPLPAFAEKARTRSDVRALEESVKLARESVKVVKSRLYPRADLTGNYYLKRIGFQENIKWDVLFALELPLFSGGQTRAELWQESLKLGEAEYDLARGLKSAELEIKKAYHELQSSINRLKTLRTAASKIEQSYRLQIREYRLGLVNNLEILEALNRLQNARRDLEFARLDIKMNRIRLKIATEELP